MIWIPLLSSLLTVLVLAGLRYRQVGLRHAAPLPLAPAAWLATAVVVAVALVVCSLRARRPLRHPLPRRAVAELSLGFVPLFALVWAVLPSDGPRPRHALLIAGLVAEYAWLLRRRKPEADPPGSRPARSLRALRQVGPATLAAIAACGVVAAATGTAPRASALALSLLTYPLFAALQLAIFLEIALPRLRALSDGRWPVLVTAAGFFALAHWPNGFLMAVCFAAMALWAAAWLRARSLAVLALCLGVAATACAQFLPAAITQHMRTGPGYVLQAHRAELSAREHALLAELTAPSFYRQEGGTPAGFVTGVCRRVLGREPQPSELQAWVRELERARREAAVRGFLGSPEYQHRVVGAAGVPQPPAASEARVAELAGEEWLQARGGDWAGFVRGLYQEVLRRSPSTSELESWSPEPELPQRTALVWRFLAGDEWASHPDEPAYAVRHLEPLLLRGEAHPPAASPPGAGKADGARAVQGGDNERSR